MYAPIFLLSLDNLSPQMVLPRSATKPWKTTALEYFLSEYHYPRRTLNVRTCGYWENIPKADWWWTCLGCRERCSWHRPRLARVRTIIIGVANQRKSHTFRNWGSNPGKSEEQIFIHSCLFSPFSLSFFLIPVLVLGNPRWNINRGVFLTAVVGRLSQNAHSVTSNHLSSSGYLRLPSNRNW